MRVHDHLCLLSGPVNVACVTCDNIERTRADERAFLVRLIEHPEDDCLICGARPTKHKWGCRHAEVAEQLRQAES